jgi:hypothetical protein
MVVFILLNQSFLPFQQQSHRFLQFEPLQCGHVFSCVAVSVGFNMAIWQILHSGWETSDFILQGRKPKLAIKVGTENIFYSKKKLLQSKCVDMWSIFIDPTRAVKWTGPAQSDHGPEGQNR